MRKEIEKLLDGSITAYQIGKAVEMNPSMIQFYINGERKLDNMTLKTAEKLYNYYLELERSKMTGDDNDANYVCQTQDKELLK